MLCILSVLCISAVSLSVWLPLCLLSFPLLLLPSLLDSEPEGSEWWAEGSPQTPGPDKVEVGWGTTNRIFLKYLLIYGCVGSSLLHAGFPRATLQLWRTGFSQWLLWLLSTGSRVLRLQ